MTWWTSKNAFILSIIATAWGTVFGIILYFIDQAFHSRSAVSGAGFLGLCFTGYFYGRAYREEMGSKLRHRVIQYYCIIEFILSAPILFIIRARISFEFLIILAAAILILYFPSYWIIGSGSRAAIRVAKK